MAYPTGDRFETVAELLFNGNKSELARNLEMKPASFSKYTSGSTMPGGEIIRRLTDLGVNAHWFITGKGEPVYRGDTIPGNADMAIQEPQVAYDLEEAGVSLYRIPVLDVETEAGTGAIVYEDADANDSAEWMTEGYIRHNYSVAPDRVRNIRVRGNSMTPTIRPGDRVRVAIHQGEDLWDGAIYVIRSPSGLIIKRLHLLPENVQLISDNSDFSTIDVSSQEFESQFTPIAWMLEVVRPL